MSTEPSSNLRILLLEDDPRDAELILHALRDAAPGSAVLQVDSRIDFVRTLDEFVPDVILSDHAVADFNVLEAFRLAQRRAPAPYTPYDSAPRACPSQRKYARGRPAKDMKVYRGMCWLSFDASGRDWEELRKRSGGNSRYVH